MSENNKIEQFKNIYNKYKENEKMNEKVMINIIFKNETMILPPKYGMPNFENVDLGLKYNEKIKEIYRYEKDEFISAFYKPFINVFICKPWENGNKCKQSDAWWYYAKKSKYFNEIKEKYGKLFE